MKGHDDSMRKFRNVPRHNGFCAWQVVAVPINEGKADIRQDLLSNVTNPRAARNIDDVEKAFDEWATNKRLFTEAGGTLPAPDLESLAHIGLLPEEIYSYVSLHLDNPEYDSLTKLKPCHRRGFSCLVIDAASVFVSDIRPCSCSIVVCVDNGDA